jgi:hypothetical protein
MSLDVFMVVRVQIDVCRLVKIIVTFDIYVAKG